MCHALYFSCLQFSWQSLQMKEWGSQTMRTWFQVALGVDPVFKSRNSSRIFFSFRAYSAALWPLRSAQGRGGFWSCSPCFDSLYLFSSCTYCPWKGHSFVSCLLPWSLRNTAAWRQFCLFYSLSPQCLRQCLEYLRPFRGYGKKIEWLWWTETFTV